MDFAFNEDQEQLRSINQRFFENEYPLARVREILEQPDSFDRDVWREGAALGWSAMLVPEEFEGGCITDQALVDLVVVAEQMGRFLYPGPFLPVNVVAFAIAEFGSELQKKELLPALVRGEVTATWCFTEDGGCDLARVGVQSAPTADGFQLAGSAMYVQDAHVADQLLVTTRSEGGLTQLLLPADHPGVEIRVLGGVDLTRRLCEVRFDGCAVPRTSLLGDAGSAKRAIERQLEVALVLQCAESVGAADHVLGMTVQYAKDRVQFGRAIGSFQAIKHKLANMFIWLETSRAAAHYAALAVQERFPDATEAVSVAKSYVGDAFSALCGEALQTHGGIGFTWEHDMHLYIRRAKSNEVLYGDPAWHRERLCRLAEERLGPAGQ